MKLFAHAEDAHDSSIEAAQHIFELNPTATTVLTIGAAVLVAAIILKLSSSKKITLYVVLFELLVIGLFAYSFAPILSGLALMCGFVLSMATAFIDESDSTKKDHSNE